MFKYKTKKEYEIEIEKIARECQGEYTFGMPMNYDVLVDEFIEFCEVSGSGI